ncbi:MAG: SRPBCC domain-containing protein [Deltaproteobacteria bacterium]
MLQRVAFTMYPVTDVDRACAFYEGALGLTRGQAGGQGEHRWIEYDLPGGGCLAITNATPNKPSASAGGTIAFEVDDLEQTIAELKAKDVPFMTDVINGPNCHMVVCADPDGNGILLHRVHPIVVEQTFDAPVERVWSAITEPNLMRQWLFETMADFEARVGFETRFTVNADGRDFVHRWRVEDVVVNERIVLDWRYEGIRGASVVTWTLAPNDGGTTLKVTHEGGHTFPQDEPAFQRKADVEGWTFLVGERLATLLR